MLAWIWAVYLTVGILVERETVSMVQLAISLDCRDIKGSTDPGTSPWVDNGSRRVRAGVVLKRLN